MEIKNIRHEDTWELRHSVIWPDRKLEFVKLADDLMGIHYGLYDEGELVSVISVFIRHQEAQFRKFATSLLKQGQGCGTKLLNYVIQDVRRLGAQNIWCNARREQAGFYEKFGFRQVGRPFEQSGIEYVTMSREFSGNQDK